MEKNKVSPTDRLTDRQTDRVGCRVACTQLKIRKNKKCKMNKAGYMATLVACGGQGRRKKSKCDRQTDRQTDGRTKRVVESRACD